MVFEKGMIGIQHLLEKVYNDVLHWFKEDIKRIVLMQDGAGVHCRKAVKKKTWKNKV